MRPGRIIHGGRRAVSLIFSREGPRRLWANFAAGAKRPVEFVRQMSPRSGIFSLIPKG